MSTMLDLRFSQQCCWRSSVLGCYSVLLASTLAHFEGITVRQNVGASPNHIKSWKSLSFSEFTYQWTFMAESVWTLYRVGEKSPYTHTVWTQSQFNFTQHSRYYSVQWQCGNSVKESASVGAIAWEFSCVVNMAGKLLGTSMTEK